MQRPTSLLFLSLLLACGPTEGGGGGSGGGSGSSSSSSFCCSINSDSYDCPNQAAADRCANFSNPDPSQCTRRSSACGGSNTGGGSGGGGGSSSSKKDIGLTCQDSSECQSDVCLFRGGAQFGLCSKECESWSDCPSFWECEQVSNGSANYCVKR